MEAQEALSKIEEHRKEIDALDEQLIRLINERATHSLAIRVLKPYANMNLYDPEREEKIYKRLEGINNGPMHSEDVREIYAALLKVMKSIKM